MSASERGDFRNSYRSSVDDWRKVPPAVSPCSPVASRLMPRTSSNVSEEKTRRSFRLSIVRRTLARRSVR
jgi:hypothetical protein